MPATPPPPPPPSLLSLPPELLLQILAFLPVRPLLFFSLASRTCHTLSLSSLHTLNFGVYPSRIASVNSRLTAAKHPIITSTTSAFSDSELSPSLASSTTTDLSTSSTAELAQALTSPHTITTIIPHAHLHRPCTLHAFQSALNASVVTRYRHSLRMLSITLWSFDTAITTALRSLHNIRTLSIRIDEPFFRQPVRSRKEERISWTVLAGAWPRLTALRLENCYITLSQLAAVIRPATNLRELWVRRCCQLNFVGSLYNILATHAIGLEVLGIDGCGRDIDEAVISDIAALKGLKYLALLDVRERVPGSLDKAAAKTWRIPEVVIPKGLSVDGPEIIEVDPAYTDGGESGSDGVPSELNSQSIVSVDNFGSVDSFAEVAA